MHDVKESKNIFSKIWFKILLVGIITIIPIGLASNIIQTHTIDQETSTAQFTEYLHTQIPILMNNYKIPGLSIALVKEGKPVWTEAFGYADRGKGRKMTADTVCRVESISKSVTAWGVMKLVEQGRIVLDAPVEQYVDSWKFPPSDFPTEEVTVRRLLSFNAGMPLGKIGVRYSPTDNNIPSLSESLTDQAVPIRQPGSSFSYSNVSYHLLELLIEEVTGRDFAEYMEEEILSPLGMYNSSFNWRSDFKTPVPNGYTGNGTPVPVYVYPEKSSGGLFAPIGDIVSFLRAGLFKYTNIHEGILSTENINTMFSPAVNTTGYYGVVFDSYGLGHFIDILPNGMKSVANGGQGSGWMTQFQFIPETGDGIVILTNSQNSWPVFSYILSDWAKWSGVSSVGMGKIVIGQKLVWIVTGLVLFLSLWQLWRLAEGLISRRRGFDPLSKNFRFLRLLQAAGFIVLSAGLIWVLTRDYFFMFSVFPLASVWLCRILFISSSILLASSVFPCTEKRYRLS